MENRLNEIGLFRYSVFSGVPPNIYAQTVSRIPCRHFVLCRVASIFLYADILVLISEFVMVVILSKWWLFI